MDNIYKKLNNNVINQGLCTHCGTCIGLSNKQLELVETDNGPIPRLINNKFALDRIVYDACPGKGFNYPSLVNSIFPSKVKDWRIGYYEDIYIGYSSDNFIRRNGASGGILTNLLIFLLKNRLIDGAVTVKQGSPKPWLAEPIIATTEEEIIECAQSVYAPIPVNIIIKKIIKFKGTLAFVGLPDQISSIRYLQTKNIDWVKKIKFFFGPYVGTNMYSGSIKSFIKSHGFNKMDEIKELKYRDGEWPGYLKVEMNDGTILKSEKFYYNYLIPFYITKSSLLSVDFCNELTDISVGDAWHPKYENKGEGYSVIVARSIKGRQLLEEMQDQQIIQLEKIDAQEAINMHAHMIDFKKRGSFIRFKFRKIFGKKVPYFGYRPKTLTITRILIEFFISCLFFISGLKISRYFLLFIPIKIIGPFFNYLRLSWKNLSKNTKRKGLNDYKVVYDK